MLSEGKEPVETTVSWRPIDAPTAKPAETNLIKAQTGVHSFSPVPYSRRRTHRVSKDPDSGYFEMA